MLCKSGSSESSVVYCVTSMSYFSTSVLSKRNCIGVASSLFVGTPKILPSISVPFQNLSLTASYISLPLVCI